MEQDNRTKGTGVKHRQGSTETPHPVAQTQLSPEAKQETGNGQVIIAGISGNKKNTRFKRAKSLQSPT